MTENYVERVNALKDELIKHINDKVVNDLSKEDDLEPYTDIEFHKDIPSSTFVDKMHHEAKCIYCIWADEDYKVYVELGDNIVVRLRVLNIEDLAAIADQLENEEYTIDNSSTEEED